MDYKTCKLCGLTKSIEKFHKHKNCKFGVRADCAECVAKYSKKYRVKNAKSIADKKHKAHKLNPNTKRRSYLKLEYNITLEKYEEILAKQNGVCAICKTATPQNSLHKHLYVDHCHETGKIREILCHRCNSTIGLSGENIERLELIISYLKKHKKSHTYLSKCNFYSQCHFGFTYRFRYAIIFL